MRILALGDRDPAHLTHRELDAAFQLMPDDVESGWTATNSREARDLGSADGVWLLPGTPYRDDAAAYAAIDYCLESGTPFLGTCGGFQYACVAPMVGASESRELHPLIQALLDASRATAAVTNASSDGG